MAQLKRSEIDGFEGLEWWTLCNDIWVKNPDAMRFVVLTDRSSSSSENDRSLLRRARRRWGFM